MKITTMLSFGVGSVMTYMVIKEFNKTKVKIDADTLKNKLIKMLD